MRILLTEHDEHQADATAAALVHQGHTVLRCTCSPELGEATLTAAGCCPLEAVDIVVAVHGDPDRAVSTRERGAVCALSADVPLVVVGDSLPEELLGAVACAPPDRIASALAAPGVDPNPPTIEERVKQAAEDAARAVGAVGATVTAVRSDIRYVMHVELSCHPDTIVTAAVMDAVREALSDGRSPADEIEVVVTESSPGPSDAVSA